MAVYNIDFSCGHKVRMKIYGVSRYRISYCAMLSTQKCPECTPSKERPYAIVFFHPERDACDILIGNSKPLRYQIYYSRRGYRFLTEHDCKYYPVQQVGWYKMVKPSEKIISEVTFCEDIGIRDIICLNDPPEALRAYLRWPSTSLTVVDLEHN